jgi:carboxypeptidase Q
MGLELNMNSISVCTAAGALAMALVPISAQENVDTDIYWKIRREAAASSRILETVHVLTDVYGPRLTGSPNLKAAGEWAVEQMKAWGLENGRLEPWDFGYPGWANERLSAHIVSPVKDPLVAEVLAWTPGTNGPIRAAAAHITLPSRPTKDTLEAHLNPLKAAVNGKIVLVGAPQVVSVTFLPVPLRREDRDVQSQFAGASPAPVPPAPATTPAPPASRSGVLTANQIDDEINRFLLSSGALARINDAGRDHGQIRAFANRTYDVATAPPTVVMRNEDYGRITRLLADRRTVELELDIVNRTYPEGRTNYNVIAEIPGSDRAQEVVMLGGHLDSWHSATGATDNAVGCAVMMEAARILKTIGVRPRRTIRVALWSGEEQGLLGSQAYVKDHFGMFENQKPDYANFAGYFNVDSGTGRIRGLTVFGPDEAGRILRDAVAPLKDLGVAGAVSTRSRQRGGTDSTSFNEAGLPGIGSALDPMQYNSHTWHTNLDTYERVVEEDVRNSAIVVAAGVYHLAMRDGLLPRFSKEQMPPRPGASQPAQPSGARQ